MKKIKRKIRLWWLNRKWVIQSVYNTKEFREARDLLQLEKELIDLYHESKRGGDKIEIARAEGRLEVVEHLKDI